MLLRPVCNREVFLNREGEFEGQTIYFLSIENRNKNNVRSVFTGDLGQLHSHYSSAKGGRYMIENQKCNRKNGF